jgi:mono/diheme cytochrome c family protein
MCDAAVQGHRQTAWVPVAALAVVALTTTVAARQAPAATNPAAAAIRNPVAPTPESIAAGRKTFTEFGCGTCHGSNGEGGLSPSITEDRGLPPPPDLIDDKWARGGSDGEIFTTIREGVGPDYIMGPFKDRLAETEIWNIINFLRSVAQKK